MRLHWIDALKGFGIMLVVFAHHSLPVALDTYIYSFHMPLFFFISGFLFDFGKYAGSALEFVKGRFRSLIVPYFCFALITCLFYFLLDELYTPGVPSIKFFEHIIFLENSIFHGTYHILYALGPMISYNPPLWFLSCLFVTEILFYGLAKSYYGKTGKLVLWLTAAGVIGHLYSIYVPFRLPWNADVALSAIVFYGAGNLFRKYTEPEKKSSAGLSPNPDWGIGVSSKLREGFIRAEKFFPAIFILLNLLYLVYLLEFPTSDKVNMNVLKYGNFFSYYVLAFSGIFTFVYLFKKFGGSRVLEYYGRNSLIVLALHFPLKDVLTKLALLSFGVDIEYYNTAFALSLTVLNLLFLVPVIFLINNYFPFLLGKKKASPESESFKICIRKPVN